MKTDCIECAGCRDKGRNKKGYGRATYQGKRWGAHRLAWFLKHGPIPANMCVLHRCDNPGCINPEHLWIGTHSDNMKDMVQKRRSNKAKGEDSGRSKLTEKNVKKIKALLAQGVVQTRIAKKFGVSPGHIGHIKTGRSWGHLFT